MKIFFNHQQLSFDDSSGLLIQAIISDSSHPSSSMWSIQTFDSFPWLSNAEKWLQGWHLAGLPTFVEFGCRPHPTKLAIARLRIILRLSADFLFCLNKKIITCRKCPLFGLNSDIFTTVVWVLQIRKRLDLCCTLKSFS